MTIESSVMTQHTRVTMADVAAAAGVSVMSVSYAYGRPDRVSEETRGKVFAAAERLGYSGPHRGAQSLRSGRTNNLAVVLTEKLTYAFDDPQARRFLSGVADACLDTDTGLVLLPNRSVDADADRVRDAAVDGYVFWTTVTGDPLLDVAVSTGRPVCVQGGPQHAGTTLISIDDVAAAEAIARVALTGARRPLVSAFPSDKHRERRLEYGPDPEGVEFPVTRNRLRGYRAAVIAAGLDWADVPVAFGTGSFRAEGVRAMQDHGRALRADAVLAMSDEVALGALEVVHEDGLDVPGDIAIVGWDDTEDAAGAGLTTVAQSLYEQGRSAARAVLGGDAVATPQWRVVRRTSTR
ncbi:LacI family transcriptional regulator [Rhodococcus sp. Leaf7]|nr:LacI family transcriptional regulator [Rhodococcus sp. Leaf7]KQU40932.1 LacI family transcriptional regulator [Rhodococcus sp. Leaf247]